MMGWIFLVLRLFPKAGQAAVFGAVHEAQGSFPQVTKSRNLQKKRQETKPVVSAGL